MICEICKNDYNNDLPTCPNCGLYNPQYGKTACRNCGETMEQEERFCSKCGTLQVKETPKNCLTCNSALKPYSSFCSHCGAPVNASNIRSTAVSISIPEEERSKAVPAKDAALPVFQPSPFTSQSRENEATVSEEILDNSKATAEPDVTSKENLAEKQAKSYAEHKTINSDSFPENKNAHNIPANITPKTEPEPKIVSAPADINASGANGFISDNGEVSSSLSQKFNKPQANDESEIQPPNAPAVEPPVNKEIDFENLPDAPPARSMHDELFSSTVSSQPYENVPLVTNPVVKKKKKSKAPVVILVLILLLLIGAIAFIWFRLIPSSIGGSVSKIMKDSLPTTDEVALPSEAPVSADAEPPSPQEYLYKSVEVIPPTWEEATAFDIVGIAKVKLAGKWGLINKQGLYIVEPIYDSIGEFNEGIAFVSLDNKFGYIDYSGAVVVPLEYDSATDFSENLGVVSKDGYYYYVSISGDKKDFGGKQSTAFSDGFACIVDPAGSYYIDTSGNKVSIDYDEAGKFSMGFAPVKMNTSWGYVNNAFELVIDYQYEEATSFKDGFAIVKKDGKKFLIDQLGNQASPLVDEIWQYKDGYATVQDSGLYGYVNGLSTDYLIAPKFIGAFGFAEGKAVVMMNQDIWYYINDQDTPAFEGSFEQAYQFSDGFACVKINDKYTLIDATGNIACEKSWDNLGSYKQGLIPVMESGKWGYVEVIPV